MYECKFCGDTFDKKCGKSAHENFCDKNPNPKEPHPTHSVKDKKVKCPECGDEVSEKQLERHKGSEICQSTSLEEKFEKVGENQYKCAECDEVYSNKGIGTHYWRKHTEEGQNFENEHITDNSNLLDENGEVWSKGLTKEDHPSIQKQAEKLSEMYSEDPKNHPMYGQSHTEEFKEWKSEQMSEFYEENPEKHPNRVLAGNRSEMTYPEKLVSEKLKELGYEFVHNKKILKYYPDFLLTEHDVIIEVDGERWHSSEEQKEYDRKRDERLENEGYDVYRIPAKNVIDNLNKVLNLV